MNAISNKPVFSNNELVEAEVERPFRPSGIVAFLLGAISSITIFSSSLLLLPAAAVLFGLYALRPARAGQNRPVGRLPAMLGIILALFFGSWSWSYFSAREALLTEQASGFAQQWLEILAAGEKEVAFELTKPKALRQMSDMSLGDFYSSANQPALEELDSFATQPAVSAVINTSQKPEWVFVETRFTDSQDIQDMVGMVFSDATGQVPPVVITMSRSTDYTEDELLPDLPRQWYVTGLQFSRY